MTTLEHTIENATSKMISPHCIVGNIYHDAVVLYLHSAWSALLDEILCYRATHTCSLEYVLCSWTVFIFGLYFAGAPCFGRIIISTSTLLTLIWVDKLNINMNWHKNTIKLTSIDVNWDKLTQIYRNWQ